MNSNAAKSIFEESEKKHGRIETSSFELQNEGCAESNSHLNRFHRFFHLILIRFKDELGERIFQVFKVLERGTLFQNVKYQTTGHMGSPSKKR